MYNIIFFLLSLSLYIYIDVQIPRTHDLFNDASLTKPKGPMNTRNQVRLSFKNCFPANHREHYCIFNCSIVGANLDATFRKGRKRKSTKSTKRSGRMRPAPLRESTWRGRCLVQLRLHGLLACNGRFTMQIFAGALAVQSSASQTGT